MPDVQGSEFRKKFRRTRSKIIFRTIPKKEIPLQLLLVLPSYTYVLYSSIKIHYFSPALEFLCFTFLQVSEPTNKSNPELQLQGAVG